MPDDDKKPDANTRAKELVDEVTDQAETVRGEDLLGSDELKKALREAKSEKK